MYGSMLIGGKERKTNTKIRIVDDFETYNNAVDVDYVIEDVNITEWLY